MKKLMAAVVLCLGAVAGSHAQVPCSPVRVTVAEPERVLTDLIASDFNVKVNGRPVQVQSAAVRPGKRFVLVLDASGSMKGRKSGSDDQRTWLLLLEAARNIISAVPGDQSIGLMKFSDQKADYVPPNSRRDLLYEALDRVWKEQAPQGMTALWDALNAATRALTPVQDGDALVVITDGDDNVSKTRLPDLQEVLAASRIRVYSILTFESLLDSYIGPDGQEHGVRESLVNMESLTQKSGGAALTYELGKWLNRPSADRAKFVTQLAGRLIALARNSYLLNLDIPSLSKRQKLRIELVGNQRNGKQSKLLYQPSIGPCTSEAHQP